MNYEITEEQIKELAKGNAKVKEWFPEVFEIKLEAGKWYKDLKDSKSLYFITEVKEDKFYYYGFNCYGLFKEKDWYLITQCELVLVTDSEVLEALTNEAKKIGFKKGVYVNRDMFVINKGTVKITSNDDFNLFGVNNCSLQLGGNCIFENGIWATLVKTYTKEEAEKMLNAKII